MIFLKNKCLLILCITTNIAIFTAQKPKATIFFETLSNVDLPIYQRIGLELNQANAWIKNVNAAAMFTDYINKINRQHQNNPHAAQITTILTEISAYILKQPNLVDLWVYISNPQPQDISDNETDNQANDESYAQILQAIQTLGLEEEFARALLELELEEEINEAELYNQFAHQPIAKKTFTAEPKEVLVVNFMQLERAVKIAKQLAQQA